MIQCSIITIGNELLIGQTIDTNSAFISKTLNDAGVWVHRKVSVGDNYQDIRKALDNELSESDIVIMTGGLGPTADDITKPLLCEYFGGKLILNEEVLEHIKYLFEHVLKRKGPLLERNIRQAEVPDNCTVLFNNRGTAPGMLFLKDHKMIFSLPGVPYEMTALMTEEVVPRIKKHFQLPVILHKTLITAGAGESYVAEKVKDFENELPENIRLAYLPQHGIVRLRLTATGNEKEALQKLTEHYFNRLKENVKDILVHDEDENMEYIVGRMLKEKNLTLGTAESCTGGYIAHLITSVPGSSAYFKGSIVSYSNEIKEKVLGVKTETLKNFGAVSEQTVIEMVNGALKTLECDYTLAVSGIMGPDGGSTEKPVGTVWVAAGAMKNSELRTETKLFQFRYDRKKNIEVTAIQALNFLRSFILKNQA
ncbi:MAG: CinA family nicotinamide mononucleotide deamidase-related protein [Chitinophagaceae bacterium]|nr:CinA family nicotinamide mononucleotide deamidase-related protein [Chitinophagaceae bacterium]